jgi:hypothetical protein
MESIRIKLLYEIQKNNKKSSYFLAFKKFSLNQHFLF